MKGPRNVVAAVELGSATELGDELGVRIVSGVPPVEPGTED